MSFKTKILQIFLNILPIMLMIFIIPFFTNDYLLTIFYILIILTAFFIKYEQKEYLFFFFGLVIMTIFEYFFISTGVETFERTSLFNIMPLWLPFLWAYAFVVVKRTIKILAV